MTNAFDVLMDEHVLRTNAGLPSVDPRSLPTWWDERNEERSRLRLEVDAEPVADAEGES